MKAILREGMGIRRQSQILIHFKRPENHRYEGRSIAQVAEMMQANVVDKGQHTGVMAGRALRRGRISTWSERQSGGGRLA